MGQGQGQAKGGRMSRTQLPEDDNSLLKGLELNRDWQANKPEYASIDTSKPWLFEPSEAYDVFGSSDWYR